MKQSVDDYFLYFAQLKTTSSSDIQKVLDLPEPTENDAEADKQLIKLQRKVKCVSNSIILTF